jgi:hypothetical protein
MREILSSSLDLEPPIDEFEISDAFITLDALVFERRL